MTSAQKATKTRKARQAFRNHYGDESYDVIKCLVNGMNTYETSATTWVPVPSVMAYKANLTRQIYGDTSFMRGAR